MPDYDEFVDWDARLAREGPFFRDVFAESGVRSVADVGCGSGRHALMFASWGLNVTGIDPDESMLNAARRNAGAAGADVPFLEGGFGDLARLLPEPVDAVTCTGNALPHVEGLAGVRFALENMAAVLRHDGVVVLHLLNHDRLLAHRIRSLPTVVRDTPEGVFVFLRVLGYETEGAIGIDFLAMIRDGEVWTLEAHRSLHTALPSATLARELTRAGFGRIELFGGHDRHPLGENDESVVLVARRVG